ncbi:hypothetical protein LEP1GSC193_1964 [Leptospira alstonii serovar Pingchang str. 80-412]|uniref:Uncharacterized protein n=2 Tax=Leptospira alstonii TaxID=28452 RepID=M6CT05_9LEPT|nr:hypothetical protein LEP1GSC194_1728 [Leptospira alstonii serovar Sichuan str. 79601]EQA81360.1 hypothetical protein LEP1GSC193_1964 [Leptospira alstonii serovar Pingchang str. 80-412]
MFLKKITFYWLAYQSRFFKKNRILPILESRTGRIRSLDCRISTPAICFKI